MGVGRRAEWILDKFEDEYEQMEREERDKGNFSFIIVDIVKPSKIPIKI